MQNWEYWEYWEYYVQFGGKSCPTCPTCPTCPPCPTAAIYHIAGLAPLKKHPPLPEQWRVFILLLMLTFPMPEYPAARR